MKKCFFIVFLVTNLCNKRVDTDEVFQAENDFASSDDGYYLDELNEIGLGNLESDVLECPTDNIITTRYRCKVDGKWVDCTRKHCCKDYVYLAGRCIHKDRDPCSMGFCEQVCTVYLQRVICTCHEGYKFNPMNQKLGIKPVCVDIDECLDNNGDCQHICMNKPGSYTCACRDGFLLRGDNRTCYPQNVNPHPIAHGQTQIADAEEANRDHCYANCDTVSRLHEKLRILQEKLSALNTAIKLSAMASGPPGPPGPAGPQGPQGPRGFAATAGAASNIPGAQDYTYSLLDNSFVPLQNEGEAYCRCKRGPQGEIGAPGVRGPKGDRGNRGLRGPKGEAGSIDVILLLLADIRFDVVHLQNKVYANGEKPPKYDYQIALQNKSQKDKARLQKQQQLLQGYLSPAVESVSPGDVTLNRKKLQSPTPPTVEEFVDNVFFITDDDDGGDDDGNYQYEEETSSPNNSNNDYYYDTT